MTGRSASLALNVFSVISSAAFGDFKPSFEQSKKTWESFKKSPTLAYTYSTEYESWTGVGQTTSITVRGETVTGRNFERWLWYYDYSDNSTYKRETVETWAEGPKDIGTHKEGESPKSLDQVYSHCQSEVLNLDPLLNTIEFKVDGNGLIKTCRARSIYCADDCWEGIDIVKLDIRLPGLAVEGCQQQGEQIICSFNSGTCTYRPSVAVMFIDHCGHRNEEILLRETQQQEFCPVLYQYSNGLYLSHEDWVQNSPCTRNEQKPQK